MQLQQLTLFFDDLTQPGWLSFNKAISASHTCICSINVTRHQHLLPKYKELLQPEELNRANRFFNQADRERSVISRAVLKVIAGSLLNVEPALIKVVPGINKKPVIEGYPGLHFNISHSKDCVAIAFSNHNVGIDVEFINKHFDYALIMKSCFSVDEIEWITKSEQPVKNFYKLWTRKEAFFKTNGKGINDEMNKLNCLNGLQASDISSSVDNYTVSSFEIGDDYVASIAYKNEDKILFYNV